MALASVEDDVVDLLDGIGGLTKGTNLFSGPVRSADRTPSPCVFVQETAGLAPRHHRGTVELRYPGVMVRVRSAEESFEAGLTLARLVVSTLHRNPPSGYIELAVDSSRPNPLGRDEKGHWEWSINATATIDETLG